MLPDWASAPFLRAQYPSSMGVTSSIACHSRYFSPSACLSPSLTTLVRATRDFSFLGHTRLIDYAFCFSQRSSLFSVLLPGVSARLFSALRGEASAICSPTRWSERVYFFQHFDKARYIEIETLPWLVQWRYTLSFHFLDQNLDYFSAGGLELNSITLISP